MKLLRRASQTVFLVLFAVLFLLTAGQVDWAGEGSLDIRSPLPVDFFLLTDPLAAFSAMLSSRSFIPVLALWALPVLVLTLLFGRAYCGWICPLGTCIDISDRSMRSRRLRRTSKEVCWPKVKYYVLGGVVVTAALGAQLVWLLDPQPLLTRSLTLGLFAPLHWLFDSLAEVPGLSALKGLGGLFPEQMTNFRTNLVALLLFALVLAGGIFSRRFWCRTLCPLGALLGVIARVPLFRRSVTAACNECTLCEQDCKMNAVGQKGAANSTAECIYCYSCVSLCRKGAAKIAPNRPDKAESLSLSRRHVLSGIVIGGLWGISARTGLATRPTRDGTSRISGFRLIRPPGSAPEDVFTERCIRCGECMKVCPTNGLQPALSEAGMGGIWTPILVPRAGECTQKCNLCGEVCPTDAIERFTVAEKDYLYMGRAAIDRSTCVVWESGRECLVCDEVCSYDAIYWQREGGIKRPFVDTARCIGCGICENNCPVGGPSAAIRVSADGDKRSMSREEQKAWRKANLVSHPEPAPGQHAAPSDPS